MGEIRIAGPGKTCGYPYPVCKKKSAQTFFDIKGYFEISVIEITRVN